MSWLSKALGGKTLKIGLALFAGGLGREYLYGNYTTHGYDISTGRYIPASSSNIFGKTLSTLGITPFRDTRLGQSAVGSFIDYLGPRDNQGNRIASDVGLFDTVPGAASAYANMQAEMPEKGRIDTTGYGVRSDTGFRPGQVQMFPVGRGGQVLNAVDRNGSYFAKQVRGMGMPAAMSLPSPNVGSGSAIQTTSMRSRGLKKLGLGK